MLHVSPFDASSRVCCYTVERNFKDLCTVGEHQIASKTIMEASVLSLPPELLVEVASYLSTRELGRLRRTCKEIESKLLESFAHEFFRTRYDRSWPYYQDVCNNADGLEDIA